METRGVYILDRGTVLLKVYQLLCLFFANKEISRRSTPDEVGSPLQSLERRFFEGEASRLLLEIAIAVRVLDDQAHRLPHGDPRRVNHERRMAAVCDYAYGLFDDIDLDLRKTCNKIVHSDVMEPSTKEGWEPHESDTDHLYGDADRSIKWKHLDGYIRLCGTDRSKKWYVLLDLEVFATAVFEVLHEEE